MLRSIQIRDFAIIDALELDVGPGMTVLTGETGAGKSILIDALLIALGGRGGSEVVRHGAARAEVTATFSIDGNTAAAAWMEEQSLDAADECVVRRVVGVDGRSRSYVNGAAMPVQALRQLGEHLVDVHGQMEYQSLVRRATQRDLIDRHGGIEAVAAKVRESWKQLKVLRDIRDQAMTSSQDRTARIELLQYYLGEFETLALKPDELPELLAERQRISQSGKLASGVRDITTLLSEAEDINAEQSLSRALNLARNLAAIDPGVQSVAQLLDESLIALREASSNLADYESRLDADPARQEWVEQRLAALEAVARKHRVEVAALDEVRQAHTAELAQLEGAMSTLASIEAQLAPATKAFFSACAALTKERSKAAASLSERVTSLMQTLGMTGGAFSVAVTSIDPGRAAEHGADEIEFLVTANPGQPLKPLARVASGGELSRISLAVQVAALESGHLPCLVFDEVDSGVGGRVAEIVGRQLRTLGERAQVLCVTHLPQVASQAHAQIRVNKLTDGQTTRTTLHTLTAEERVEEIARMLGGIEVTARAREHAAEMLSQSAIPSTKPPAAKPAEGKRRARR
jgi:DNA repair protein RecN (Recombination protein N)